MGTLHNEIESEAIRAYQRGWNDAQDWQQPHLNPFVEPHTRMAWFDGYTDARGDHANHDNPVSLSHMLDRM